jgi:DNA-directed RNA polymerase specialized sigma24 family protein
MAEPGRPWWENNAEIAAARDEIARWLESAEPLPPDLPDPVWNDLLSGASTRELAAARDDLERANARYADAVKTARTAGLSWGEIGCVLSLSRQALHRRFRDATH